MGIDTDIDKMEAKLSAIGCDEATVERYVRSQLRSLWLSYRSHGDKDGMKEIEEVAYERGMVRRDLLASPQAIVNEHPDGSADVYGVSGVAETSDHDLGSYGTSRLTYTGPVLVTERRTRSPRPRMSAPQPPADLLADLEASLAVQLKEAL